jgi:K+/H+ antiporter YhaU regulatory subunit KhtT
VADLRFLGELVVVLGAAVVVVLILSGLRLPTIAGFIVAGAIVGPGALAWVSEIKPLMQAGDRGGGAGVRGVGGGDRPVLRTSAIARNVIGERIKHARLSGPAAQRALTVPRRTLGESRELDELKIESFLVNVGAWIAGRSVAESELRRRTGVTMLAWSREGASATHPVPADVVEAGDILYLVGGGEELAEARRLLDHGPDAGTSPRTR